MSSLMSQPLNVSKLTIGKVQEVNESITKTYDPSQAAPLAVCTHR